MDETKLIELLHSLLQLSRETEWVEFKLNNFEPEETGEYLSALCNSAALHRKERAYLIWGVEDATHRAVGTTFRPHSERVGNEEFENWLVRLLHPHVEFTIYEFEYRCFPIVLFEIRPCKHTPVRFRETEYIRVGSYKKKLRDFPEKERALWEQLSPTPFERQVAAEKLNADEILSLIDYPGYFELTDQNLPADKKGIIDRLATEKIIASEGQLWNITNLGALLFAKRLSDFDRLARKAVRVIIYRGLNRIDTLKEQVGTKGYAVGFEGLISYVNDQLPRNEQIGRALRREAGMYPEIAIRELVANAVIHQSLQVTGDSPLIEIFDDRLEITNAGQPLISTLRFIDEPPQSRNEVFASFMRRLKICEERGSGIDKVIFHIELFQLPAPNFLVTENHTKVIVYAQRKLSEMDRNDKVRACYQHACLLYVSNQKMTNASLRKRLSIEEQNYAIASRIIADTIDAKLVKPFDPDNTSRKYASYIPFWA